MNTLAIYGAGGLGREVLELAMIINEKKKRWDEIIFVIDSDDVHETSGHAVYRYEDAKQKYGNAFQVVLAIGEPAIRERLFEKVLKDNIALPSLIHPEVHIPESASIGCGSIIQYGCFVSCNVSIGNNVLLQPMCAIGHDCVIGDGSVVSTFCGIAGAVDLGRYVYIGTGSVVKEQVAIGDFAIIGMASAVYKDIPADVIAMGNPARPMKKNEEHKVFRHS